MIPRRIRELPSQALLLATLANLACNAFRMELPEDFRNTECSEANNQLVANFTYPTGLYCQEQSSAELEKPGQHPSFGALLPWPEILQHVTSGRKLLLLIRHGEAVSNAVQSYVGNLAWRTVSSQCVWNNASSQEDLQLFDPSLTDAGRTQASALHAALAIGETKLADLTGTKPWSVVVSPLSRCAPPYSRCGLGMTLFLQGRHEGSPLFPNALHRTLETFRLVMGSFVEESSVQVDEFCRERFGHNTCDARRPASLDESSIWGHGEGAPLTSVRQLDAALFVERDRGHAIQCPVDKTLTEKFPGVQFRTTGLEGTLGLVSNTDTWWEDDQRESDDAIEARARAFLTRVFQYVLEDVVFVVSHSGMIGAILRAMGREAYSAQNAELVPAVVEFQRYEMHEAACREGSCPRRT